MAWGIHAFDEQTENDNTVSDGLQDAFLWLWNYWRI